MSKEPKLKSAYELAMERLHAQDVEEGVGDRKALTDDQKNEIAGLRRDAEAKLAELKILHEKSMTTETDPAKLQELEEHHRIDRGRVESSLESAVDRVRRGDN